MMDGMPPRRHVWLVKGKGVLTAAHEDLVRAVLIAQLGSVALARLKLDSDLLLVEQVGALENDAEAALADFLPDAIVHAHHVGRRSAAAHLERKSRWFAGGEGSRVGVGVREDRSRLRGRMGAMQPTGEGASVTGGPGGRSSDGAAAAAWREMGGKHGGGEKNGRRKSACMEGRKATERDRVEMWMGKECG